MPEWGIPIGLLLVMSFMTGIPTMKRCAMVIAANWIAASAYVGISGNLTPWAWFWAIDMAAAIIVVIPPKGWVQRVIAYLYLGQIGIHAGFGIGRIGSPLNYLQALDVVLAAQMLLLGGWIVAHGVGEWSGRHRLSGNGAPHNGSGT